MEEAEPSMSSGAGRRRLLTVSRFHPHTHYRAIPGQRDSLSKEQSRDMIALSVRMERMKQPTKRIVMNWKKSDRPVAVRAYRDELF